MESKIKTQSLFLRGQVRITLVILIGLAAILLLVVYSLLKKSAPTQAVAPALSAKIKKQAVPQKGSETKIIKVGAEQESSVSEEGGSSVRQPQQAPEGKLVQILKSRGSCLATDLENVPVMVKEGERIKSTFKLTNNGKEPVPIAIYKSEFGQTREGAEAELEKLLYYKNNAPSQNKGNNDAIQASVFAGAPELMLSPQYATLAPGEEKEIALTINAKQLDSDKEYTAYLYVVGTNKADSLIIPLNIEPQPAPKISLAKVEVDDGFSADTQGNTNNVANPNETVAVTVTLENKGAASAEGLSVSVSSSDTAVSILGDNPIQIATLGPHSQFPLRILIQVSSAAHPVYPPALYLTMTDVQGRKWQENFYAGEPGKFEYPTGLKKEEASGDKNE